MNDCFQLNDTATQYDERALTGLVLSFGHQLDAAPMTKVEVVHSQ